MKTRRPANRVEGREEGSVSGAPSLALRGVYRRGMRVVADGRTVVEVLNEIVAQSAPRGWWVIRSNDTSARIEQVGFIHRSGSMSSQVVELP